MSRRYLLLAAALLFSAASTSGPSAEPPAIEGKDWPGLHREGKRFDSMNLGRTQVKVDFFYHGPEEGKPHLEGRVVKEAQEAVTVGVTLWNDEVAFSAYDKVRKTLEVYLLPRHLQDPKKVRPAMLPLEEFKAPPDIRTVRVIFLP